MNIRSQKVIAREFLSFLLCIVLTILAFLAIYPYNYLKRYEIKRLENEVLGKTKLSDSLSRSYKEKEAMQLWFTNQLRRRYNLSATDGYSNSEVWDRLAVISKKDSSQLDSVLGGDKESMSFQRELGLSSPAAFRKFIQNNIVYESDSKRNKEGEKIAYEVELLEKKIAKGKQQLMSTDDQLKMSLIVFVASVILLILLRHLISSIVWSINVLRKP